ncbi:MAG: sialate O-acetylesterase [Verrucomicrobiae bacterium]
MRFLDLLLTATLVSSPAWADVVLPSIISDHMVLQKTAKARIWGKADPGEQVTVTLDAATGKSSAGADGKWAVELNLSESKPGPFAMAVQGKNRIAVADVVVGEVWVASGQSNMEFSLKEALGAPEEIAASANPMLRQFAVEKATSFEPLDQCKGYWAVAKPESAYLFSAVGYYFGKRLQKELQTPVGIINSCWWMTASEEWTSREALNTVPELKAVADRDITTYQEYSEKKAAYAAAFGKWAADNAREDRPTPDAAAYAGVGVSTEGWLKVTLPWLTSPGLPTGGGIFWLRKELTITAQEAKQLTGLKFHAALDYFESVYWNGQLIQSSSSSIKDLQEKSCYRSVDIPADLVKEGNAVLTLRVYAPISAPKFLCGFKNSSEACISGEWLAKAEVVFPEIDAKQVAAAPAAFPERQFPQLIPTSLFGGMIAPIIPYAIKGVIWYQGESNVPRAWQYRTAFPLMIQDWRSHWNQGDFPFYFCQLANFKAKSATPSEDNWAELREAQSATLKTPHTGQAVLIDLGESDDVHPRNKMDVGDRLAVLALANDYGKTIPFSGPVFQSMKIENGKARLNFAHIVGGLVAQPVPASYVKSSFKNESAPLVRNSPGSELEGFAICSEDQKWVWADAKIDGDTVLVWSDRVPKPVAVRYGWANNPTCNLYNKAGLPASPFRTDDFPISTQEPKHPL